MKRRRFLVCAGLVTLAAIRHACAMEGMMTQAQKNRRITLFLCGDVMTGRGIDQILPHPSRPQLHEPYMRSATGYVRLAEAVNGPIPRPADFAYPWGEALDELRQMAPDLRIVNLETAVTTSEDAWPGKGIHYRMHPRNLPCLTVAGLDCCVLANNHVLDWGYAGLAETLSSLHAVGINTAGAGRDADEAAAPAILTVPGKGRVLVFAWGLEDSGVPPGWAAGPGRPGINLLPELSSRSLSLAVGQIRAAQRPGDLVIASLHWGGNWGYTVSRAQRDFAHGLIDSAGVDVVHGHSSHHVKGMEVYRDRPILYGCGDFLNDYEGIAGYEEFRGELALMYFPSMEDGRLVRFTLTPTQTRCLQIRRAPEVGLRWLMATLNRESNRFGTRVTRLDAERLQVQWRS